MSDPETLSPEKQLQILRGAGAVFGAEGYEGASMSHIAAAAGVSKGTLYNYFASKADLFAAFIERECSLKIAQILEGADTGDDPADTLACIAHRMIRLVLSPTGLTIYRVCVAEAAKFPELARTFFEAGPARSLAQMSRWLAEQDRRGALVVPDPDFAAEQFFALCQTRLGIRARLGLLGELREGEVEEVVRGAVSMFLRFHGRPAAAPEGGDGSTEGLS